MNNLQFLTEFYSEKNDREVRYANGSNHALLDLQTAECVEFFRNSKKFFLSVEKSQFYYDKYDFNNYRIKDTLDFKLPFDCVSLIFEKALKIYWVDIDQKEDKKTDLIGTTIKFLQKSNDIDIYKAYLHFDEGDEGELRALSEQYVLFTYSKNGSDKGTPYVTFPKHYPCRNKDICNIDYDTGFRKIASNEGEVAVFKGSVRMFVCQEILNRESLLETIFNLIEKIHESEVELVKRKKPHKIFNPEGKVLPVKPNLMTKGNLPKENYVQFLDGKSRRYDPEDIDYGTGTKHQYRYDVRRHPRIVDGKIVWINSHTRGNGKYIPKVYSNRRTWFVNYLWYQAEKLTKYRIAEILLVKIIQLFKLKIHP